MNELIFIRLDSINEFRRLPQRCPCPDPQNLWVCTSRNKRDFADVIKDLKTGGRSWMIWPHVITRVPLRGRHVMTEAGGCGQRERFEEAVLLALKMEEGL